MSSSYLGQQSDGSLNSSSTGYCVPSSAISIEFSPFSVLLITLIVADLVALMIMIGCVWRETVERQAYKLAKGKPVKLMLTQEYLAQLRPMPKKLPDLLPTDPDLHSIVV